jgi:hypothetical protein
MIVPPAAQIGPETELVKALRPVAEQGITETAVALAGPEGCAQLCALPFLRWRTAVDRLTEKIIPRLARLDILNRCGDGPVDRCP